MSGVDDPSLTEFYDAGYRQPDPATAERLGRWRALGAQSKAAHVVELCRRAGVAPRSLVEVGCGDGALLAELARRDLAERYDGFELSAPAAEIAAGRAIPGAGRIEAYDGARVPAADGAYDLGVLSHVLEHVPEPAALLAETARVARHVLVEVPLERNRSGTRPQKVAESRAIGHIQAFDRDAVVALATAAGLRVLADLSDPLPRAHHAFFAQGGAERARAAAKWAVRAGLWRVAPRRAETLFTVHYACLLGRT
ncbi:MAG TPA: class I SAM-dependent methyltransferase [Solirubrobacteraceae bacterium]|nr:class I SAM-dependent methyltransferase [Solirubrobacteraceae bacterium]